MGISMKEQRVSTFHHKFQGLQTFQIFINFIDSFVNKEKRREIILKRGWEAEF